MKTRMIRVARPSYKGIMKKIILSSNVRRINETKKGKVINMVCLQGRRINFLIGRKKN